MATAFLETRAARRDVQLVVGNENLLRLDLVEPCYRRDRLAAAIHKGCRDQQAQVMPGYGGATGHAVELGIGLQGAARIAGQCLNEIGARVVPGTPVLTTGIAQANNQQDVG